MTQQPTARRFWPAELVARVRRTCLWCWALGAAETVARRGPTAGGHGGVVEDERSARSGDLIGTDVEVVGERCHVLLRLRGAVIGDVAGAEVAILEGAAGGDPPGQFSSSATRTMTSTPCSWQAGSSRSAGS
jgi:hypothetical protein